MTWQTDAWVESEGPTAMRDNDLCIAVGEDLSRAYPGYPWLVGANHEAGTVVIDLGLPKPPDLRNYAYLLHIGSCLGPGGRDKVLRAGGELLERFRLPRDTAPRDRIERAQDNGFDAAEPVTKSRSGPADMRAKEWKP